MKNVDPKTVRIQWDAHVIHCLKCQQYQPDRLATLALVCVQGAELIKDVLEFESKPVLAKKRQHERDVYKAAMEITNEQGPTTKKKAHAAMRFVE